MTLPEPFQNALILTGPTASGKSALALDLAQRLNAEIIAMDSMTLYRGMDIGTAKPTKEERALVPHHLIDILDPWERGNVADWLREAERSCRDIEERGKQPLFVGGTPFFLKALLQGLFDGPPTDLEIRRALEEEAKQLGPDAFHAQLAEVDPVSAQRLHPNDIRRVVRALEVWRLTGKPISELQRQKWWDSSNPDLASRMASPNLASRMASASGLSREADDPKEPIRGLTPPGSPDGFSPGSPDGFPPESPDGVPPDSPDDFPHCLVIDVPREELYSRIDRRVEAMIGAGWIDEVRRLRELPQPWSKEASQALGYREISAFLDGHGTLADGVETIQLRSRQFAKRQLTWFRHLPGCQLCEAKLTIDYWSRKMS